MCTKYMIPVSVVVVLIAGCGTSQQAAPAAVADSVALACTPVLVPGPDDAGTIGAFAPGPGGLMAWDDGMRRNTLMIGNSVNSAVTVGRSGEGPGEFGMIDRVGWSSDTVWATDLFQARVQFFDRNGALLDVRPLPSGAGWLRAPNGNFLAIGSRPIAAKGWSVLQVAGDSSAPTADTLFHFPGSGSEVITVPMAEGRSMITNQPFAPTAVVGAAEDGSRFCGSEPLEGDQVRIRCIDYHGAFLRDTVLALAPVPLDDSTWNHAVSRFVGKDESRRSRVETLFTRPKSIPLVTALGVDRDGALWIDRSNRGAPVQHFMRLTPGGALRDTLLLTRGYIATVSNDTLWRVSSDSNGMKSVERCVPRR